MKKVITLLTDFGTSDEYVGVMKGVILSIANDVHIVDITHHVEPGDILQGQFYLATSWKFFPEGTVHVAVIDPGVGTSRKALIVKNRGHFFVGPDNGLFTFAIPHAEEIFEIDLNNPFTLKPVSSTFHGRDVFAPVGAAIAKGANLSELGKPLKKNPVELPLPAPEEGPGKISGEVLFFDRFGNALTNIPWREDITKVILEDVQLVLPIAKCYGDVPVGEKAALPGSRGYLEISVNRGSAQRELRLTRGTKVTAILRS